MMIDTHAHLYLCKRSLQDLIINAKEAGITHIINVGIDIQTGLQALALSNQCPHIFPTIGIHPCETQHSHSLEELETLLKKHPFKAIGEIGLDYYHMTAPKPKQIEVFETQLGLAQKLGLPVIIHNREADEDMINCIKKFSAVKKVFHCYGSKPTITDQLLAPNHYFSFTGTITYAKKGKTIQSIKKIPLSQIMIETDCPYLTPKDHKGEENQPAFVGEIAQKIALVKDLSLKEVVDQTTQNAVGFFKL
jgi:TatD DNase family protein